MPIKGLSEQRRLPRVGKIHLGVKKKKGDVEYPSATDYFVCPPEIEAVYGQKPKELPIMIPVEDEEYWASQYYRAYSRTRGLVCKGDGENCNRMIDTTTGEMANRDTKAVVWKPAKCEGRECPYYKSKQCREVMNLQFLLPDIPGIGIWQVDTSSINSIRNINSGAELIRGICGRVRMLPLLLTLEKQEVVNPDDGKKKNVCVLNLRLRQSLQSLLADSVKPIQELLAPVPAEDEAPLDEVEEVGELAKDLKQVVVDLEQAEKDSKELWDGLGSESSLEPLEDMPQEKPRVESKVSDPLPGDYLHQSEPEKVPGADPKTWDELVSWLVVNKGWKDGTFARTWMVNNGIPEDKLTDIDFCVKEIKRIEKW